MEEGPWRRRNTPLEEVEVALVMMQRERTEMNAGEELRITGVV